MVEQPGPQARPNSHAGASKSTPRGVPSCSTWTQWYPKDVLAQYLEHGDGLSGATLRKVVVEQDENKSIDDPAHVKKYGTIDLVIKRRWKPDQSLMGKLLGNQLGMDEAIEVLIPPDAVNGPVKSIKPDELLLSLDFDNRGPMSVSVTRDRAPRAGFPVGSVQVDGDGYPVLSAMVERAGEVQADITAALGWK